MNNISIGDEVIVHEPSDCSEYPIWVPMMDKYVGKIMSVRSVFKFHDAVTVKLCGAEHYHFNINWLERVTADDDFDTEIGGLYE